MVRIPDSATGWLSVWEVTPDGSRRSAVAVFQPDRGLVRPDVAITAWDRCCSAPDLIDHQTPDAAEWDRIVEDGVDHAYQAAARIAGERRLHPAWCSTSACRADHGVKQWLAAQIGRLLNAATGAVVILDPDGVLTDADVDELAETIEVIRVTDWIELRRVWDLDIRRRETHQNVALLRLER